MAVFLSIKVSDKILNKSLHNLLVAIQIFRRSLGKLGYFCKIGYLLMDGKEHARSKTNG